MMDMCLLCLETSSEKYLTASSLRWQEEQIESLIQKHLWALSSIEPESWLCTSCWKSIEDFHSFYVRIEKVHSCFASILKTEVLENSEDKDSIVVSNNFQTENIVEISNKDQEMSPSETCSEPLAIKSESINEEEIVPVNELSDKGILSPDPLERPLTSRNRGRSKAVKSSKLNPARCREILAKVDNSPEENSQTTNNPTDIVDHTDSSDTYSENESDNEEKLEATDSWKPRPNPYYKRKAKRIEIDEFLSKHYKITCALCQLSMTTFCELRKHFTKQHNEPGYAVCCNRKFVKCSLLVDHIHCHLDPEYFKCKHCDKIMSDRRCLKLHVNTHGIQDKIYVCDICSKAFSRKTGLKNHKLIHLSDEEKKFACEHCGKPFGNENLLANHVRVVHLNKYALVCDICGEKMRGKDVFERHILKHKGVPLPTISCDVCGLKVTNQRGLKRHKESQHPEGGRQQYPCHLCSQVSPTHKAHKKHVKDKHELGYDFKCTMCEKAYKRSSTLKEHMATHTGTILYTCSYCPKTFNSNANMHSHRKKAHPKEWEEECRAKYSGNLPPKYKLKCTTTTTDDSKWF
ncbi:transcription factor grauzone [Stomoxys calcitrans]|uniref:transcription factor grauzone n=1 Tax=Stomoxys calcitrans TaxID=35570 RepID=UPI0027E39207|nr:transcription factor grauzone [Stomoxys calcitrans]